MKKLIWIIVTVLLLILIGGYYFFFYKKQAIPNGFKSTSSNSVAAAFGRSFVSDNTTWTIVDGRPTKITDSPSYETTLSSDQRYAIVSLDQVPGDYTAKSPNDTGKFWFILDRQDKVYWSVPDSLRPYDFSPDSKSIASIKICPESSCTNNGSVLAVSDLNFTSIKEVAKTPGESIAEIWWNKADAIYYQTTVAIESDTNPLPWLYRVNPTTNKVDKVVQVSDAQPGPNSNIAYDNDSGKTVLLNTETKKTIEISPEALLSNCAWGQDGSFYFITQDSFRLNKVAPDLSSVSTITQLTQKQAYDQLITSGNKLFLIDNKTLYEQKQ